MIYELILITDEIVRIIVPKHMTLRFMLQDKNIKIKGYKVIK